MKKILTAIITILFVQTLSAQEYSDVIGLESKDVLNATFAVTGIASDNDKDLLEENAKKSIVYNILYKGVGGWRTQRKKEIKPVVSADSSFT